MELSENKQNQEEIDFFKLGEEVSRMLKQYYVSQYSDLNALLNNLIETEREIIDKRGKGKNTVEELVLKSIKDIYDDWINGFEFDYDYLDDKLVKRTNNKDLKQIHSTSLELLNLVKKIFNYKMARDNFSSKRKGYAIKIFFSILYEYFIRDDFQIIKNALNSKKDHFIIQTLGELNSFIEGTETELPKDLIQTLVQLIKKTKNRWVAVGCLKVLITIGNETELSALMRIDDWKEQNYYNE